MAKDPDSGVKRRRTLPAQVPPLPPPPDLGATDEDLTPVEHLAAQIATIQRTVVDQAAVLAERYEMPSSEAWARMQKQISDLAEQVAKLDDDRKQRTEREARWARVLAWARPVVGGLVLTLLTWAVAELGNAGARRRDAAALVTSVDRVIEAVEKLAETVRAIERTQIADHALLEQHLRRESP